LAAHTVEMEEVSATPRPPLRQTIITCQGMVCYDGEPTIRNEIFKIDELQEMDKIPLTAQFLKLVMKCVPEQAAETVMDDSNRQIQDLLQEIKTFISESNAHFLYTRGKEKRRNT